MHRGYMGFVTSISTYLVNEVQGKDDDLGQMLQGEESIYLSTKVLKQC